MKLSCVTASYVADPLGYPGAIDWGLASEMMKAAPMIETIAGMLDRLAPAKLDGLELYYPHIWPGNVTPVLASEIRRGLAARGMVCCACAGGVVDPASDAYGAEELFQTAQLLHAPMIAGHAHFPDIGPLTELCQRYGVHVAYENGGEPDAAAIIDAIHGGNEWVGANIDTGNMAAQGGDPVRAIRQLGERILHVHLKDVAAVGGHDCVAIGAGIVDVPGVMQALRELAYDGWLSIEIETGDHDPTEEIIASAAYLRELLAEL
jgi:sugar phosphate isomerase/epimerase